VGTLSQWPEGGEVAKAYAEKKPEPYDGTVRFCGVTFTREAWMRDPEACKWYARQQLIRRFDSIRVG